MAHNIELMQNATSLAGLAQTTNLLLDGYWYGWFILATMFLITFIYLLGKGYNKVSSAAAGVWLCTILSLMLLPMGLIDSFTLWLFVFMTPVMLFALWFSGIPEMPS